MVRFAPLACGALSLAVHLGGSVLLASLDAAKIAGAMPSAARLGNSFADVAEGSAVSAPGPATALPTSAALAASIPKTVVFLPAEVAEPATQPAKTAPLVAVPEQSDVAAASPMPDARITPVSDDIAPALETSPRPIRRPDPEAGAPERPPKSLCRRRLQRQRAQRRVQPRPNVLASQTAPLTAPRVKRAAKGAANTEAGNAAASSFPGLVMRKINLTRKPIVGARGTATVGFEIAANGALARVVLLKSSGNASIDAAAVDHLQRAAPFPAPPAGADRRFQVTYVSRG